MLDMLEALKNRNQQPGMEELPEEEIEDEDDDSGDQPNLDPRGMSADGKTLFIDKEQFPPNCKVGDDVMIAATVTKHGSKYGIVVNEITAANSGSGEEEPAKY